jgi:nucleotide-binding universal stress UspA family protein
MIKRILVAIGNEPYEHNAFDYAGHLAVFLDAHLSCVCFQDADAEHSEDFNRGLLNRTAAECDEFGLKHDVELVLGRPTEMIPQKARTADLFVIGLSESIKTQGLKLVYDQIDNILLNITKPTVVVHEECTVLSKILVAHRGDHHSDRALELATEFGERTNAGLLGLAIGETRAEASRITQNMQEYLRYHDVKTEFLTELGYTVRNVLETAENRDCDLIAIGASPRGRLYERIYQTTTESVVKLSNRAVLVCR